MSLLEGPGWGLLHVGQILSKRRQWFGATIGEVVQLDGRWTDARVAEIEAAKFVEADDFARYQRVIERLKQRDRERRSGKTDR